MTFFFNTLGHSDMTGILKSSHNTKYKTHTCSYIIYNIEMENKKKVYKISYIF